MFVTEGVYTRKVAAEVGSALKYLFEHPDDTDFIKLELVYHHPDGDKDQTEFIRLVDQPEARVVTLANGREIVRCITRSGKRLDIIFGHEDEREIEPVLVLIDESP